MLEWLRLLWTGKGILWVLLRCSHGPQSTTASPLAPSSATTSFSCASCWLMTRVANPSCKRSPVPQRWLLHAFWSLIKLIIMQNVRLDWYPASDSLYIYRWWFMLLIPSMQARGPLEGSSDQANDHLRSEVSQLLCPLTQYLTTGKNAGWCSMRSVSQDFCTGCYLLNWQLHTTSKSYLCSFGEATKDGFYLFIVWLFAGC